MREVQTTSGFQYVDHFALAESGVTQQGLERLTPLSGRRSCPVPQTKTVCYLVVGQQAYVRRSISKHFKRRVLSKYGLRSLTIGSWDGASPGHISINDDYSPKTQ